MGLHQTHEMLHNDITASSRTNRSAMPYNPSRLVTSPFCYMETSSSLSVEESGRLEGAPPFPGRLNGARRHAKSEVLDFFSKAGVDETVLDNSVVFDDTLSLCLEELQFLDQVGVVLVKLTILVDVSEESPVIEVVDGILKNGIGGSVAPEVTAEPGGEGFQRLVRCVVRRGIQLNDLCILLSLCLTVKSGSPPIIELLDEAGKLLGPIVEGDGKVGEMSVVLLVPRWALGEAVSIIVVIGLLLEHGDFSLESLHLLSVDIIPNSDGVSKSVDDGPELVRGRVRSGGEDVLYRGGGEREPPGVDGGNGNLCPLLSEVSALEGVIRPGTEVSREAFHGLFRG